MQKNKAAITDEEQKMKNNLKSLTYSFVRYAVVPLLLIQCCFAPQITRAGANGGAVIFRGVLTPWGQAEVDGWTLAQLKILVAAGINVKVAGPGGLTTGPLGNDSLFFTTDVGPSPIATLGPGGPIPLAVGFDKDTSVIAQWTLAGQIVSRFPKNGDLVDGGGLDLLPYITPTSCNPTGMVTVNFPTTNGAFLKFTGAWYASDAGSASRVQFYDVTDTNSPVLLNEYLFLASGTTPTNGSFTVNILIPASGATNIQIVTDGITASIPAPEILSVSKEGANARIVWQGTGGHSYSLQAASSLSGVNVFSDIGPLVMFPASGSVYTNSVVTNYLDAGVITNSPKRFYRVRMN